ncbi:MAG: SUMF1/EgtB/PvdO family nonheme iron enzyme, partial [Saprospiraceae bacterium]
LIYFSGHGVAEARNGYFVPADGQLDKLYSTGFAYEYWREFINQIDCRHILVSIDACFSATFDPDWYNKKMDPDEFHRPGELSEGDKLLQANESDRCRIAFTSDGSEDKVPEKSNFARKFLEALQNGPRQDGILTSEVLAGYLRFSAPKPRLKAFGDDENGSFLLVQKAGLTQAETKTAPETAELEKDFAAWKAAKAANTIAAYQAYLANFQQGEFREQGQAAIARINTDLALRRDDLAWQVAEEKNSVAGYQKYLTDFPSGRHTAEAQGKTKAPDMPDDGLVLVRGGTFMMGCTSEQQDCSDSEKPAHIVTLNDFYIGRYEVNQKLWKQVMGTNPSKFTNCDDCPVEQVSWEDVQGFLQKLNAQSPGHTYRLPTEAEWEYAARGGGKAVLFGNGKNTSDPSEINFDASAGDRKPYSVAGNYRHKTVPVGSLNSPNALGLHDMSGNVLEWCSDWYDANYYKNSPSSNPIGPSSGSLRVRRSGSWLNFPQDCRVACRNRLSPGIRYYTVGFRLARTM